VGSQILSTKAISVEKLVSPRVLILYDEIDFYQSIIEKIELESEFDYIGSQDILNSKKLIEEYEPDLVINLQSKFSKNIVNPRRQYDRLISWLFIGDEENRTDAYEAGYDDFILYPCETNLIYTIMVYRYKKQTDIAGYMEQTMNNEVSNSSIFKRVVSSQMANVIRSKVGFTLTFISIEKNMQDKQAMSHVELKKMNNKLSMFLVGKIRNSDILFNLGYENEFVVLLPNSQENEAKFFINRLFTAFKEASTTNFEDCYLNAAVVQVENSKSTLEVIENVGRTALIQSMQKAPWTVEYVNDFIDKEIEVVKVSIIIGERVLSDIVVGLIERLNLENFVMDIKTFENGDEFLTSTWHNSGHTHLVILDEILPRKNGIEVLVELRHMPNTKKFIITMMSNHKSENDMIYAFNQGADEYITKPFNPKYLSAYIKRILTRLR